jgi:hypothetical protein
VLAELGEIARWNLSDEKSPVRAADKLKALELAGKYHKLFTDRVETTDGPGDPTRLASDLTAVLGVVREAIEAYRVATQMGQVVQGATESGDGLTGPSLDQQPIIDVTPIDHVPLLPSAITTDD